MVIDLGSISARAGAEAMLAAPRAIAARARAPQIRDRIVISSSLSPGRAWRRLRVRREPVTNWRRAQDGPEHDAIRRRGGSRFFLG